MSAIYIHTNLENQTALGMRAQSHSKVQHYSQLLVEVWGALQQRVHSTTATKKILKTDDKKYPIALLGF